MWRTTASNDPPPKLRRSKRLPVAACAQKLPAHRPGPFAAFWSASPRLITRGMENSSSAQLCTTWTIWMRRATPSRIRTNTTLLAVPRCRCVNSRAMDAANEEAEAEWRQNAKCDFWENKYFSFIKFFNFSAFKFYGVLSNEQFIVRHQYRYRYVLCRSYDSTGFCSNFPIITTTRLCDVLQCCVHIKVADQLAWISAQNIHCHFPKNSLSKRFFIQRKVILYELISKWKTCAINWDWADALLTPKKQISKL